MTFTITRYAGVFGFILAIASFILSDVAHGEVVVIGASRDNTLYENGSGILSNGAGSFLFAGQNSFGGGFLNRRGLVRFDVASSVPAGSVVNSAELIMNLSQTQPTSTTNITLHRVSQDWGVRATTVQVADNMVAPVLLTHANDGTDRLFVVDQAGVIRLIKNGTLLSTPYLDAGSLIVSPLGGIIPPFQEPFSDFDERGLLGLAFHPDFAQKGMPGFGMFYTYSSEPLDGPADFTVDLPPGEMFNHQAVIREWTVDPTADAIVGDPGSISRKLMTIDEPQFNHDGGHVAFGPDQMLYISLGDGGGGGDDEPGHGKTGNGQDASNVLGTILRIDPFGNNSANGQYGVPADNPFVADPEKVDEIYAYGLRNPYRFSFDGSMLIVADVGQSNIEEVDIVNSGDNLGWRLKEGSLFYDHVTNTISTTPFGELPKDFNPVDPVMQYDHSEGISITGGFVYRGSEFPDLVGKYVFGDFSNAGFFVPGGRLFYGDLTTGEILEFDLGCELGLYVKGFGQDANGELYVMGGTNLGPFRDSNGRGYGSVHRLSPRTDTTANSITVIRGIHTGGTVDDLCTSNNTDYSIQRSPIQATGVIEAEIKAVTTITNPTTFEFTLEAAGFFRSPVIQSIEFFDYDAGAFVEFDSRNASRFSDSIAVAIGTGDLSRFVEDGTGCVLTRVLYTSVVQRQAFSAAIDQVSWTIE